MSYITKEQLEEIGLFQEPSQPWRFHDNEDIEYHLNTGKLYSLDCVNGINDELIATTKDLEELKQIIWDAFPYLRYHLNLD